MDKVVHRAKWLNDKGDCRPLCRPRGPKVNYAKEQSATDDSRVTCPKCRALLQPTKPPPTGETGLERMTRQTRAVATLPCEFDGEPCYGCATCFARATVRVLDAESQPSKAETGT